MFCLYYSGRLLIFKKRQTLPRKKLYISKGRNLIIRVFTLWLSGLECGQAVRSTHKHYLHYTCTCTFFSTESLHNVMLYINQFESNLKKIHIYFSRWLPPSSSTLASIMSCSFLLRFIPASASMLLIMGVHEHVYSFSWAQMLNHLYLEPSWTGAKSRAIDSQLLLVIVLAL